MEDYEKKYKEALELARDYYKANLKLNNADENLLLEDIFPELKESEDEKTRKALIEMVHDTTGDELWVDYNVHKEDALAWLEKQKSVTCNTIDSSNDEKIRKALVRFHKSTIDIDGIKGADILAWLEKQCYTKKDVDDAYLKGICDAKHELDKQGTPAKLSEEEQNRFAKVVLTSCALSFIDFLDAHKYEGKMCVSNGECEDIENAFHNAMWDRLHRYYCKYIEKQGEQKPADKSATNKQEDEIEIPFGAKDSELQEATYYIPKGFHAEIDDDKVVIKKGEKSAAWSNEDELIVLSIKQVIQSASSLNLVPEKLDKINKWLKHLKDRIGGKLWITSMKST